jgi:hypothetical protein
VHIACGAALFNLRLAAGVAGRQAVVRLLPDPGTPLLLTATAAGIATGLLTQPLETGDAWLVRDPRSGIEQPTASTASKTS